MGEVIEVGPAEEEEVFGGKIIGYGGDEEGGGARAGAGERGGGGGEVAEEVDHAFEFGYIGEVVVVVGGARFPAGRGGAGGGEGVGKVVDGVDLEYVHFFYFLCFPVGILIWEEVDVVKEAGDGGWGETTSDDEKIH